MRDLIIIKFGGSSITFKEVSPPRVNKSVICDAAGDIKDYDGNIIIVLGGGAHGHQAAYKYGYGNKTTPKRQLLQGISEIRHNMNILSTEVEHIFRSYGIDAVVISPFTFVLMDNGEISTFPTDIIQRALDANLVVITHGDVCFDKVKGATILSGDVIISFLAKQFDASRVLLGTNVDGLFTEDPNINPDAKLIEVVNESDSELIESARSSTSTDVTGGMSLKINELLKLADGKREIVIFNLMVPHRLAQVIRREKVPCTRVQVKERNQM